MYKLYANCIVVDGYLRSVIYDLQLEDFDFVSREFSFLLKRKEGFSESDIVNSNLTDEFLVLKQKKYFFDTKNHSLDLFSDLSLDFSDSSRIGVLIINVSAWCRFSNLSLAQFVDEFNVKSVVFIDDENCEEFMLMALLNELKFTTVTTIEIILSFIEKHDFDYSKLEEDRISKIVIYGQKKESIQNHDNILVVYKHGSFDKRKLFHQHPNYFNVNKPLYLESINRNNYFSDKLYINSEGNILNTPEKQDVLNHLSLLSNNEDIYPILESENYRELSFAKKDFCDVCRYCEFRYMCVDNRLPLKRNNNEWYHEIECNYNPFIALWEGEEGYLSLKDCLIISDAKGFLIDEDYLEKLVNKIWK